MSASTQKTNKIKGHEAPDVAVRYAKPKDATKIWYINYTGRLATQPNPSIGLSVEKMRGFFAATYGEDFPGRNIFSWLDMIKDKDFTQAVFVAQPKDTDKIAGIIRPNFVDNERWVSNLYVAQEFQRKGIASALLDKAFEWLGDGPVHLKVASYNTSAQSFYENRGFMVTDETSYTLGDVEIPQYVMTHPGV